MCEDGITAYILESFEDETVRFSFTSLVEPTISQPENCSINCSSPCFVHKRRIKIGIYIYI